MTAGSWTYIGTLRIVGGTFETFAEAGRQQHKGNLKGRWILTGGLGGMGGATPLAAVMAGACCLAVERDKTRIDFRIRTKYLDAKAKTLDEARVLIDQWTAAGEAKSAGLLGNAADVFPDLIKRMKAGGHRPDIVTHQTSAHDPLHGYLPQGWGVAEWRARQVEKAARASMRTHVAAMVVFWNAGVPTLDYGNNIRQGGPGRRLGKGLRLRRFRARPYPPHVPQGHRPVPRVRAVGRPPKTPTCTAGSTWPPTASPFRVCRPASAGSALATGTARA